MKVYECIINNNLTIYINANKEQLKTFIDAFFGFKEFKSLTLTNTDYRVEFTQP